MNENKELLRFTTAGSVDDGKSTLIGRLLYDSKSVYQDQIDNIKEVSKRRGEKDINLALLTDGLRAEREQGITIDVAYRYFSTPRRKFIVADTPGHIEYTRNMVTGASTANVALILIDARNGVVEQTKRHAIIASLLRIPHLLICINKMDLVGFDQGRFRAIQEEFEGFASKLDVTDVHFVPISALTGDNVVNRSSQMTWYEGSTLLYYLENVHIASDYNLIDTRFPVQYVIRPYDDNHHDFRGYAGQIAGGVMRTGDEIRTLPSGFTSRISGMWIGDKKVEEAFAPQSVVVEIEDQLDLSRGDMICRPNNSAVPAQDIDLMMCWFDASKPLNPRGKYMIRHTSKEVKCKILSIQYRLDIETLHRESDDCVIKMNDIARIKLRTASPLFVDPYKKNRATGSIILIDIQTNNTVAAGMIL